MHIKAQTFIPVNTKITKCKPSNGKGKNIYSLLRAEEKKFEKKLEKQVELKTRADLVTQLLKKGYTVQEALILSSSC